MKATQLHLLQLHPFSKIGVTMRVFIALFFLSIAIFAKPVVTVSIPPQAYFLKQITQDTLQINTLIPQGSDPHTFEFKPSTLSMLSKSKIYFTIGLEFEKIWLPKLKSNLSNTAIFSITKGITFIANDSHHEHHHEHHEHEHHHHDDENDPHIWLSPKLVKILAQNMTAILVENFPEYKALYEANLEKFLAKLDALDAQIAQILSPLKNRKFVVYHPSWSYFAQAYNLVQIPVEVEGKEPKAKELKHLISMLKKEKIKVIFAQNGFSKKSAQSIADASGAKVIITDPLAYEWEKEMLFISKSLAQWEK